MFENLLNINRLSDITTSYLINNNKNGFASKSDIGIKIEDNPKNKTYIISKGGEIFQQKLIDYCSSSNARKHAKKVPTLTANDLVSTQENFNNVLLENPNEKIRFKSYPKIYRKRLDEAKKMKTKRYFNKIQRFREMVIKLLKCKIFTNFLVGLLILDSILIAISVNLSTYKNKAEYRGVLTILLSLQITFTVLFLFESICQLFIDYKYFFKSPWNILDVIITLTSTLFEIINFLYYFVSHDTTNDLGFRIISDLRVFRILKLLKIISHFLQLRIIVIALTKAFRSVVLISILLIIFAYIYATVGVVLFENMRNRIDDEFVNDCFENINNALLTLFAVMTLDQWWKIFTNACESNDNDLASNLYFISWILLTSFIFQNLFTGAMVNHFQKIRENIENALKLKLLKSLANNDDATDLKDSLNEDLFLEERLSSFTKTSSDDKRLSKNIQSNEDDVEKRKELKKVLELMETKRDINRKWLKFVNDRIETLIEDIKEANKGTLWPEDTLLHYYGLMQTLMDNLHERMILLDYANNALLLMHDRDNIQFPLSNYDSAMKKNN